MDQRTRVERLERQRPSANEPRETTLARINAKLDGIRARLDTPEPDPSQVEDILAEVQAFRVGLRQRLNRR